jgi:hypothetical protein
VNRRRIDTVSVGPSRTAVAYLTIWSYCRLSSPQSIG